MSNLSQKMELLMQKSFKGANNWREGTIWSANKTFHLRHNPPNPRILSLLPCLECVGFTQISLSASTILYSPVAQYLSGIYAMCTQRMLKKFVLWLAIIQLLALFIFKLFIFFHQQQLQSRYHIHLAWIYFHLKSDKSSFNSNYVQQAHVGYGSLQK